LASESAPVPDRLRRFVVSGDDGEMLDATEAARRLGVARAAIYDRVVEGTLLAWRRPDHGLVVPAEQIRGRNDVVPGLRELSTVIDNPRLLWSFLSHRQPFAEGMHRPIDLLAKGLIDDVVGAARGYGSSPT
jgi:hypothetical protein